VHDTAGSSHLSVEEEECPVCLKRGGGVAWGRGEGEGLVPAHATSCCSAWLNQREREGERERESERARAEGEESAHHIQYCSFFFFHFPFY